MLPYSDKQRSFKTILCGVKFRDQYLHSVILVSATKAIHVSKINFLCISVKFFYKAEKNIFGCEI